jgi:putative transposase
MEQDHRFIKRITRPMLGFKAFHSADKSGTAIATPSKAAMQRIRP